MFLFGRRRQKLKLLASDVDAFRRLGVGDASDVEDNVGKSTVEVSRSEFGAAQMLIAQLTTSGEVAGKKQGERRPRPTDAQLLLAQASNAISAEVNLVEAMRGAGPYEGSRHDEWRSSWVDSTCFAVYCRFHGTFGTKRDVGPLHGSPYVSAV